MKAARLAPNVVERRDPRWVSASRFLRPSAQFREIVRAAHIATNQSEEDAYTDHLMNVAQRIRSYRLPVQTIAVDEYEQVAEIFNRVNTGGRRLSKGDLVMGALAARWQNGRRRIEDFESELDVLGWRFNREVLLRIMSVIAAGGPNHVRLVELKDEGDWRRGWEQTEAAVRHAAEFLERDAQIPNVRLLPSEYLVLVPAVLLHKQRGRLQPGQADELSRWVYLAGAFAHYSGSTETTLAADLNLMGRNESEQFQRLIRDVQTPRTPESRITGEDLRGKGLRSPLLKLLQLRALQTNARSWWNHRALSHAAPLRTLEVEVHHIFPKNWLHKNGQGRIQSGTQWQISHFCRRPTIFRSATRTRLHISHKHSPMSSPRNGYLTTRTCGELSVFPTFVPAVESCRPTH